jgi:ferritin-like metal-binding protein YciE
MNPTTLLDLFVLQIQDLYDAENQILDALPAMIANSTSPKLKEAFELHLRETKEHVQRLQWIAEKLGIDIEGEVCEAIEGLIAEGEEALELSDIPPYIKDMAIIFSAQRIEHYEIAGYGCARALAQMLDLPSEVIEKLDDTLTEEGDADKKLTKVTPDLLTSDDLTTERETATLVEE